MGGDWVGLGRWVGQGWWAGRGGAGLGAGLESKDLGRTLPGFLTLVSNLVALGRSCVESPFHPPWARDAKT